VQPDAKTTLLVLQRSTRRDRWQTMGGNMHKPDCIGLRAVRTCACPVMQAGTSIAAAESPLQAPRQKYYNSAPSPWLVASIKQSILPYCLGM
jgi:hypothetical protein